MFNGGEDEERLQKISFIICKLTLKMYEKKITRKQQF